MKDVFEQFFCPAGDDFLAARMTGYGFQVCRGENSTASCVRSGEGKCEHIGFSIQVSKMLSLPTVDEDTARRKERLPKVPKN